MSKVSRVKDPKAQEIIYLFEDIIDESEEQEYPLTGEMRSALDSFVREVRHDESKEA